MQRLARGFGAGAAVAVLLGAIASDAHAQGTGGSGMAATPGTDPGGAAAPANGGAADPGNAPAAPPANGGGAPAANGGKKADSGGPAGFSYGDHRPVLLAGGGGGGVHHGKRMSVPSNVAVATYPGFQMRDDGGSRVFVNLTKSVDVEEHKAAGVVTYLLKGARVVHRNNENALVTVLFNTPVTRAKLTDAPGHKGILLVIDLRGDASPTYKLDTADGATRLIVDFPQGQYLDENGEPLRSAPIAGADANAKPTRGKRSARARRAAAATPPRPSNDSTQ
jgi:hypothetical protein